MSLIDFVEHNDIDGVKYYDNTVNEINLQDKSNYTALITASLRGNIEIVKLLLEIETININLQDNDGMTALICASWSNNIEVVKLLLEIKDINVNIQDDNKNTALILASYDNNKEIIKLLLEHETINVNLQNKNGATALILASIKGNIEIVKLLLNVENINVNLQNSYKATALTSASIFRRIKIIKLLLSKGTTVPSKFSYSNDINEVLANWKTYLPRWNRFKTFKYYPEEFKDIVMLWLLICKRKNLVSKDIKLLMIEYLAESWKLN